MYPRSRHYNGAVRLVCKSSNKPHSITYNFASQSFANTSRNLQSRGTHNQAEDLRTKSSSNTPPLPQQSTTKKKIELHPSPRKPDVVKSSIPGPLPLSNAKRPSTSENVSTALSDVERTKYHPIQAMVEDMRKESQHGVLKPPPEDANKIQRFIHQVKELIKFYYKGVLLINTHRKTVADIHRRIREEKAAGRDTKLTRWERQFIRTFRSDVAKLVPFLLVVLIAEEIIPLMVMYAPGMLPSTCILPSQQDSIYAREESKRLKALSSIKEAIKEARIDVNSLEKMSETDSLQRSILKPLCSAFALSSWGPSSLLRYRLNRHIQYLKEDDSILSSERNGQNLSLSELRVALYERGFVLDGQQPNSLAGYLASWLQSITEGRSPTVLVLDRAIRSTSR